MDGDFPVGVFFVPFLQEFLENGEVINRWEEVDSAFADIRPTSSDDVDGVGVCFEHETFVFKVGDVMTPEEGGVFGFGFDVPTCDDADGVD